MNLADTQQSPEKSPGVLSHALELHARGFHVIPLRDPGAEGKRPRLNNWERFATAPANEATIAKWFTDWPQANIGIATGGTSRLVAIDVDGELGVKSWAELASGRAVPTLVSLSGGGNGLHRIFRVPESFDLAKIRNSVKFRPGLDVRATGGQVVAPPSLHESGNRYEWLDPNAPIADLPAWLYDVISTAAPAERKAATRTHHRNDPPLAERKARALVALSKFPPAVQGGAEAGHTTLLKAARLVYRGYDLPRDDAKELLVSYYNPRCVPPWEGAELHKDFDRKLNEAEKDLDGDEAWGVALDAELLNEPANDTSAPLAPSNVVSLADRLPRPGQPKHPTGIATLDRATRGGLRPGTFMGLGGAPGAGKTTLAIQLAVHYARAGIPVAILAADEGPETIAIRIGQILGCDRDVLEAGGDRERFETAITGLPLSLLSSDDGVTVESAAAHLAASGAGVLIVDSIQTARTATSTKAEGPRARVDDVVAALKAAARRHGHVVIATSELARGAYRSKKAEENVDPLAAAKESGAIEYACTVILNLTSPKGEGGEVDVVVPKNRLGAEKPEFRMRLDPTRATFAETEKPPPVPDVSPRERRQAIMRQLWTVVRDNNHKLASKASVEREWRDAGYKASNPDLRDALAALIEQKRIEQNGDKGLKFFWCNPWPVEDDEGS